MLEQVTWFGRSSRLELTGGFGMTIEAPYAYFVKGGADAAAIEPAAVDLQCTIGEAAEATGSALAYSPQYAHLTIGQRRYYLDWLAGGRRKPPADAGYAYLYFYGLERRLLLDRQDTRDVFKAVLRLVRLDTEDTAPQHLIQRASSLLWHVLVRDGSLFTVADLQTVVPAFLAMDDDEALAAVLGFWVGKNIPLADWLAYPVAGQLPKSQRSVVTRRVGDELAELFRKRYSEQFGSGLMLQPSKRDRRFEYQPANRVLPLSTFTAPSPAGLLSQFDDLADLWNSCVADLKRLSTLKVSDSAETLDVWRATPPELRQSVDHPLVEALTTFIGERAGDSGDVRVTPREVAKVIGIAPDAKLTLPVSRRIAEAVTETGYCLEPDAGLTGRAYADAEPVVLFLNLSDAPLDTAKYSAASTMLNVGFLVAAADGQAEDAELGLLTQQLEAAFSLNDTEQRRLEALRGLRAECGIEAAELSRVLRSLTKEQQTLIGRLMLALVAADGQVSKAEIKTVRRVYSAMGWTRYDADAALATLMPAPSTANDDALVSVLPATPGQAGEPIPPPPAATPAFVLDRAAIDALLRETHDVARLLAEAMKTDELPDSGPASSWAFLPPSPAPAPPLFAAPFSSGPVSVDPPATPSNEAVSGLPEQYAAFYQQVISRPSWPHADLVEMAKAHGLMLSGAVEAINEWSSDTHGGPLIYDDGDAFTLEPAYLTLNS